MARSSCPRVSQTLRSSTRASQLRTLVGEFLASGAALGEPKFSTRQLWRATRGPLSSLRAPEFVRLRLGRFSLARGNTGRARESRESEDEADDSLDAELDDVEDTDDVEETDDAYRDLERLRAIGDGPLDRVRERDLSPIYSFSPLS